MVSTIPTVALALCSLTPLSALSRRHIHALPDEIVRHALSHLTPPELDRARKVCSRWLRLATALKGTRFLPWGILKRIFALLDRPSLKAATRVCCHWKAIALHFFSPTLGVRHAHDLPAEVVKRSFALLDFDNLRYAAQVCVRWRDLGIEHPGFWQNIEATSATDGALSLLASRLGQSAGRPFTLSVDIPGLHPLVDTKLMALLTAIMPSVQDLRIRINSMYLIDLWKVLNHPAPQMTSFRLKLYSPDRLVPRVPLMPWIFDKLPGVLTTLWIEDVMLCNVALGYPAFSLVRYMRLMFPLGALCPFPGFLLECCPVLEELVIFVGTFTYTDKLSEQAQKVLSRLRFLDVHLDVPERAVFVQTMANYLNAIPTVILSSPLDYDAAYDFLDGVGGPFNLAMTRIASEEFYITVQSVRSWFRRIFAELDATYAPPPEDNESANVLFENHLFPEQVQFLKVSISLWDELAPYLGFYTVLDKLILDLDALPHCLDSALMLPRTPLPFPNLSALVLETRSTLRVAIDADELLRFANDILDAPERVTLALHRVILRGSSDAVTRRFAAVTFSWEASAGLCDGLV